MTFDSPDEGTSFTVDLEFASIIIGVVVDGQVLTRSVAGFDPVDALAAGNGSPDLVGATCSVPLDHLGLGVSVLTRDIHALSIEYAD